MKRCIKVAMALLLLVSSSTAYAAEASGTGSMIAAPLMKIWADAYSMYSPGSIVKYKGSSPAEGIKSLTSKEVDFSSIDMPLELAKLKKNELVQFPIALGGVAPIVNLPGVYPGQFKLDGQTLGDIFLGNIKKWNDPALVALNPNIRLPDANIIVIHRVSPEGISTIIGDYLAKTHTQWKSIKGDGMAGTWPATAIAVKNPNENIEMNKKTPFAIGYGPVAHIMKNGMAYAQLKNKAGKFISPSDDNIAAAASNASWDENNGFGVVLTDQPGDASWPLSFASFVIMPKVSAHPERSREALKFFKYSLRYGGLKAIQIDYIPLPDSVRSLVSSRWNNIVDEKGVPILKK